MSMPQFPNPLPQITREQAVNSILLSIAMEEIALSHILNAEGEKIQYIIEYAKRHHCQDNLDKICEANKSVACVLEQAGRIEAMLAEKLKLVMSRCPETKPPCTQSRPGKHCACVIEDNWWRNRCQ